MSDADALVDSTTRQPRRTLDQLSDQAFDALAKFIGECVRDTNFTGLCISTAADENGKPLWVKFESVDMQPEGDAPMVEAP